MADFPGNNSFFSFTLGQFDCISVSDGSFDYNPYHLIADLKEEEISGILRKYNIPEDRLTTPYSFLYVNTQYQKILLDMGAGKLGPNTGKLITNLKAAGVSAEEIDTVIITHAHPDHIGGTLDESGHPNFPNADYVMWKKEFDFWFSDEAIQEVEEHLSNIVPTEVFIKVARGQLGPIKDRIHLITEEQEYYSGVQLHFAPGHTPGHMIVSFHSEGNDLYFTSDLVVFPFLLQEENIRLSIDMLPEMAAKSKNEYCDLISEKNAWVHAQHFPPFPSTGKIIKDQNGWKWQPAKP